VVQAACFERSIPAAKLVRGDLEKSRFKALAVNPRGAKPMGGASDRRLKNLCGRQALSEGLNPVTEALQAGLTPRRQKYCRANGKRVPLSRKAAEILREVKPPKGESHERRRRETKPAGDSREQAVKRVAKP
jgi:hypothetical protein